MLQNLLLSTYLVCAVFPTVNAMHAESFDGVQIYKKVRFGERLEPIRKHEFGKDYLIADAVRECSTSREKLFANHWDVNNEIKKETSVLKAFHEVLNRFLSDQIESIESIKSCGSFNTGLYKGKTKNNREVFIKLIEKDLESGKKEVVYMPGQTYSILSKYDEIAKTYATFKFADGYYLEIQELIDGVSAEEYLKTATKETIIEYYVKKWSTLIKCASEGVFLSSDLSDNNVMIKNAPGPLDIKFVDQAQAINKSFCQNGREHSYTTRSGKDHALDFGIGLWGLHSELRIDAPDEWISRAILINIQNAIKDYCSLKGKTDSVCADIFSEIFCRLINDFRGRTKSEVDLVSKIFKKLPEVALGNKVIMDAVNQINVKLLVKKNVEEEVLTKNRETLKPTVFTSKYLEQTTSEARTYGKLADKAKVQASLKTKYSCAKVLNVKTEEPKKNPNEVIEAFKLKKHNQFQVKHTDTPNDKEKVLVYFSYYKNELQGYIDCGFESITTADGRKVSLTNLKGSIEKKMSLVENLLKKKDGRSAKPIFDNVTELMNVVRKSIAAQKENEKKERSTQKIQEESTNGFLGTIYKTVSTAVSFLSFIAARR